MMTICGDEDGACSGSDDVGWFFLLLLILPRWT
jgi:hypothetical protein